MRQHRRSSSPGHGFRRAWRTFPARDPVFEIELDGSKVQRRNGWPGFAGRMTGAAEHREADPNRSMPASDQKEVWEIKTPAPAARRSERKRSGERRHSGERGRRRTRQDQISLWGFGPGEIAKLQGAPHRTKKTCFFCRTGFERASPSEIRSSRLT